MCASVGVDHTLFCGNVLSLNRKWIALRARGWSLDPPGLSGSPTVPGSVLKYLYDILTLNLSQEKERQFVFVAGVGWGDSKLCPELCGIF